ncbi:MAG: hypothetical protein FVQ79_10350 [Planctomycetes bacterium]|nr:hypothetical protein [Planctomycetota bacterium]
MVQVRRSGFSIKITVHEKYRWIIKSFKYIFTVLGLSSAFISLGSVLVAFIFGLGIYLLVFSLEKIIFSYTSLFIHPLPNFDIEDDKWLGCFFGYMEDPEARIQIPLVGMYFSSEEYAKNIHSLILSWNYGGQVDKSHNICLSVVEKGPREYVFCCYPNYDRLGAKEFAGKLESERKKQSLTEEHMRHFIFQFLGKTCDITPDSYFPTFKKRYQDGAPYRFQICFLDQNQTPKPLEDGRVDFILDHLKIVSENNLTRKDLEYDVLRILDS